jgi:hypothetical protein
VEYVFPIGSKMVTFFKRAYLKNLTLLWGLVKASPRAVTSQGSVGEGEEEGSNIGSSARVYVAPSRVQS